MVLLTYLTDFSKILTFVYRITQRDYVAVSINHRLLTDVLLL